MKVAVKVKLKPSILDPQGKAVHQALQQLGFDAINGVRIGKFIELEVADSADPAERERQIEEATRKLLSNPVMEVFEIEAGEGESS
ncbi:MAG TPA: phosphoribosylformylglycinamidine synthase subunit PurS [Calditrichia bacterium]|nr:phosphoribosylformylglycinamidine synthase subunit PurS [Calditrichota bacterium]HQU71834.1 phosphoribosylformylglycinamidine synthase subunit PurS [Calditrichia bacterium]HQV33097.1 phosphoribosylformylglycinamidine synthase subunit PurS [Calditrichia bacterium]